MGNRKSIHSIGMSSDDELEISEADTSEKYFTDLTSIFKGFSRFVKGENGDEIEDGVILVSEDDETNIPVK